MPACQDIELREHPITSSPNMEHEPEQNGISSPEVGLLDAASDAEYSAHNAQVNRRTILKLDLLLLPFLSMLFLLNALDKSNIGNAEAAHFTQDLGLPAAALNRSVACFFAVFVAMQPIGAALGRRYGMARWVPACMALWGVCTTLHVAVRSEWQLILLRILVGALEAGFYPTTVSYLSLFYTRYEFAKRLGFFYGQSALAGALGGLLSWAVFKHFEDHQPSPVPPDTQSIRGWKSWEVLFLIEGCCTIVVALVGFFWLPHSADTAWFLTEEEQQWAELRIRRDLSASSPSHASQKDRSESIANEQTVTNEDLRRVSTSRSHEEGARLLSDYHPITRRDRRSSVVSTLSVTADNGLSRADIFSAILDWKVWYLLVCNILSAIPATAFSVFLPLVIRGLTSSDEGLAPAKANLLAIPPFLGGAVILWIFTWYSDRYRERFKPILYGLAILLIGLTATVMLPREAYVLRYLSLIVLLSGSFVASPLTVAWFSNNVPEHGKRAIVLGINGWGNLAGVVSAVLFAPRFASEGYVTPFYVTLACVMLSFVGYLAFRAILVAENAKRAHIATAWTTDEVNRENLLGDVDLPSAYGGILRRLGSLVRLDKFLAWMDVDRSRKGDEKITFQYGL